MLLLCLGDSNTECHYLPAEQRWTTLVGDRLGVEVVNFGKDGATVAGLLGSRRLRKALRMKPGWTTIGFGVNDSNKTTVEDFTRDVRTLTGMVNGPHLMTAVWLDYPDHYSTNRRNDEIGPFNDRIRQVAADLHVPLIDIALRLQREAAAGNWDVRIRNGCLDASQDAGKTVESKWWNNVHLNANGCQVVADETVQVLTARRA